MNPICKCVFVALSHWDAFTLELRCLYMKTQAHHACILFPQTRSLGLMGKWTRRRSFSTESRQFTFYLLRVLSSLISAFAFVRATPWRAKIHFLYALSWFREHFSIPGSKGSEVSGTCSAVSGRVFLDLIFCARVIVSCLSGSYAIDCVPVRLCVIIFIHAHHSCTRAGRCTQWAPARG